MLKLSKLADYAVVIITALDSHEDELVSASILAQENTFARNRQSPKFLKLLSASNIVTSIRGVKGGYKLSAGIDKISIKDVITALDGPIALTACVEDSGEGCEFAPTCAMHGRWNRVNRAIKEALEVVSIYDMTQFERLKKQNKKRA